MPSNFAAWMKQPFEPLTVDQAQLTAPKDGQILVRTRAVAVNPIDRYKQKLGKALYGWVKYPLVPGFDLAGEVADVGEGVTRFKVGDRVLALATGMEKARNSPHETAFQLYSLVSAELACPIPDSVTFEAASVLPLALSTAAVGLFEPDHLGLDRPVAAPVDKDQTVLVWSGSSSVGSNAIQLAVNAGYRVVTTASPHNHDYVRGLGAAAVYDYNDPDIIAIVSKALNGHDVAGAMAIGPGSTEACIRILGACRGRKRVAVATFPVDIDALPDRPGGITLMTKMLPRMAASIVRLWISARRRGVQTSTIWGASLMATDLGRAIFEDFLPDALRSGAYIPAPPPLVVGEGLDALQDAFERQKEGVSAMKVVVKL